MERKNDTGKIAENGVCKRLSREGHRILARNYSTRYGEIDIIYIERESGDLVFAEVKYRQDASCGYPYEYVTERKLKRIEQCAESFLQSYVGELPEYMRIDVFSVLGDFDNIEHFRNVTL